MAIWYWPGSDSFRADHHDKTSMNPDDWTTSINKYWLISSPLPPMPRCD
jgi:hypothetical protein